VGNLVAKDLRGKRDRIFSEAAIRLSYYASKSSTKTGRMPVPQEAHKN